MELLPKKEQLTIQKTYEDDKRSSYFEDNRKDYKR